MTTANGPGLALTVGQVAEQFGVTVRTLHHYDAIGLLVPSGRTPAGYRLYTGEDITRLQHIVVYRRLSFPLQEIADLLADQAVADNGAVIEHLHRQRAAVLSRLDEMRDLVTAIDQALEREMSGIKLTKEEQQELFGEGFSDDYAEEAEQRWGETDAWKQSQRRTSKYSKEDWVKIKAEMEANGAAFAAAMEAGLPATSVEAMDAAEESRLHIERWFYDITPDFHRNLGDMHVADPRFTKNYEDIRPGMAQYVRDAIHANADRAAH
ncbi:MAG: MerR family transcriptional regulator, thiopeptide resistance regulator [Actinomycetota bacterium]|nr:MerR family transcriptional regulator, thiopeptide resistance regulator [Actinomycetota bacterium]